VMPRRLPHLGDRVRITNGDIGTVIASMDTDEYGPEATREDWAHVGGGILLRTDRGALVQLDDSHSRLVSRDDPNTQFRGFCALCLT
jgi:hypothetical protein